MIYQRYEVLIYIRGTSLTSQFSRLTNKNVDIYLLNYKQIKFVLDENRWK